MQTLLGRFGLPFFLLLLILGSTAVADAPVKVFLLAGQSNMVGAGQVKANPARHDGHVGLAREDEDLHWRLRSDDADFAEREQDDGDSEPAELIPHD